MTAGPRAPGTGRGACAGSAGGRALVTSERVTGALAAVSSLASDFLPHPEAASAVCHVRLAPAPGPLHPLPGRGAPPHPCAAQGTEALEGSPKAAVAVSPVCTPWGSRPQGACLGPAMRPAGAGLNGGVPGAVGAGGFQSEGRGLGTGREHGVGRPAWGQASGPSGRSGRGRRRGDSRESPPHGAVDVASDSFPPVLSHALAPEATGRPGSHEAAHLRPRAAPLCRSRCPYRGDRQGPLTVSPLQLAEALRGRRLECPL